MNQGHFARYFQIAARIQRTAKSLGLVRGALSLVELFDTLITDKLLRNTTRQLFIDGHYAQSVEEAYKLINNFVKQKTGLSIDGASLMKNAFSANNPFLRISALRTPSQRDQQLGYMEILSGCMTGIRNPRAHEHQYLDKPEVALEMIAWANHLIRIVKKSRISQKKGVTSAP
jgi:uncharacterized protein (TIGR02391 family)